MDQRTAIARTRVTVRLPQDLKDRVQFIAAAEHRSVAGYIEILIEQDLRARKEAERVVHFFLASELEGTAFGPIVREDDEDGEPYAIRAEALNILPGGPGP